MKKILLSLILLICVTSVSAQINYGLKGGFNAAMGGYGSKLDMRPNFYFGAHAEIDIDAKFSIQPELVYSRQGHVERYGTTDRKDTYRLDYINIPVLCKYYINDKWTVEAGPQIGVNVNAKMVEYDEFRIEDPINVNADFTLFDLSLAFGTSWNFSDVFAVSLRYNIGLIDIYKPTHVSIHNNVLQLGLDFTF